jgi:hypothetical protein
MKTLKKLEIVMKNVLKNEDLLHLKGGRNPCTEESGTCGYECIEEWREYGECNKSYAYVQCIINSDQCQGTLYWCCDHCYETFYCGGGY